MNNLPSKSTNLLRSITTALTLLLAGCAGTQVNVRLDSSKPSSASKAPVKLDRTTEPSDSSADVIQQAPESTTVSEFRQMIKNSCGLEPAFEQGHYAKFYRLEESSKRDSDLACILSQSEKATRCHARVIAHSNNPNYWNWNADAFTVCSRRSEMNEFIDTITGDEELNSDTYKFF